LPNYQEPEPLLRDTIRRLARHRQVTTEVSFTNLLRLLMRVLIGMQIHAMSLS
jgi:hypothetical protein